MIAADTLTDGYASMVGRSYVSIAARLDAIQMEAIVENLIWTDLDSVKTMRESLVSHAETLKLLISFGYKGQAQRDAHYLRQGDLEATERAIKWLDTIIDSR